MLAHASPAGGPHLGSPSPRCPVQGPRSQDLPVMTQRNRLPCVPMGRYFSKTAFFTHTKMTFPIWEEGESHRFMDMEPEGAVLIAPSGRTASCPGFLHFLHQVCTGRGRAETCPREISRFDLITARRCTYTGIQSCLTAAFLQPQDHFYARHSGLCRPFLQSILPLACKTCAWGVQPQGAPLAAASSRSQSSVQGQTQAPELPSCRAGQGKHPWAAGGHGEAGESLHCKAQPVLSGICSATWATVLIFKTSLLVISF